MAYQRYQDGIVNFMCEYARSGRAKCKACHNEIKKNHLKIGTRGIGYDHWDDSLWFHYRCFWTKCFYRKHAMRLDPEDPDIAGYCYLKDADKERVKKSIVKLQEHLRAKEEQASGSSTSGKGSVTVTNKPVTVQKSSDKEEAEVPVKEKEDASESPNSESKGSSTAQNSSDSQGGSSTIDVAQNTSDSQGGSSTIDVAQNTSDSQGGSSKSDASEGGSGSKSSGVLECFTYDICKNLSIFARKTSDPYDLIAIELKRVEMENKACFSTMQWRCFTSDRIVDCIDEAIKDWEDVRKSREEEPQSKKKKKASKQDANMFVSGIECIDLAPAMGTIEVRLTGDRQVVIQIPHSLFGGTEQEGLTLFVEEWENVKKCFGNIKKQVSQKLGVKLKKVRDSQY